MASILEINEDLNKTFNVFGPSPNNLRKENISTNVVLPIINNLEKKYFM